MGLVVAFSGPSSQPQAGLWKFPSTPSTFARQQRLDARDCGRVAPCGPAEHMSFTPAHNNSENANTRAEDSGQIADSDPPLHREWLFLHVDLIKISTAWRWENV